MHPAIGLMRLMLMSSLPSLPGRRICALIIGAVVLAAIFALALALFAPGLTGLSARWTGILVGAVTFAPMLLIPAFFMIVGLESGRRWRFANDN